MSMKMALVEAMLKKAVLMGAASPETESLNTSILKAGLLQVAIRGSIDGDGNAGGSGRRHCQWRSDN